jgi:hypothetical protein
METLPFVLRPEEARVLEEEQIFLGAPTNGKRKVSAALLSELFLSPIIRPSLRNLDC